MKKLILGILLLSNIFVKANHFTFFSNTDNLFFNNCQRVTASQLALDADFISLYDLDQDMQFELGLIPKNNIIKNCNEVAIENESVRLSVKYGEAQVPFSELKVYLGLHDIRIEKIDSYYNSCVTLYNILSNKYCNFNSLDQSFKSLVEEAFLLIKNDRKDKAATRTAPSACYTTYSLAWDDSEAQYHDDLLTCAGQSIGLSIGAGPVGPVYAYFCGRSKLKKFRTRNAVLYNNYLNCLAAAQ
jgi:hypothetical protein